VADKASIAADNRRYYWIDTTAHEMIVYIISVIIQCVIIQCVLWRMEHPYYTHYRGHTDTGLGLQRGYCNTISEPTEVIGHDGWTLLRVPRSKVDPFV
jgi:hypothetical protein